MEHAYDLWYDASSVGVDMVVECWIPTAPEPTAAPSIPNPATG